MIGFNQYYGKDQKLQKSATCLPQSEVSRGSCSISAQREPNDKLHQNQRNWPWQACDLAALLILVHLKHFTFVKPC